MTATAVPSRLQEILPVLRCATCRGGISSLRDVLKCDECGEEFPVRVGCPVFVSGLDPRIMSPDHLSNPIPESVMEWLVWQPGWVLNLGSGGTRIKLNHVVEVEYSIFRHTDVVADAHRLPFADASFEAVVTLNTFEHLHSPELAAAEVRRVLKPGGRLVLQTAFLQPVHEAPHHYYNSTEYGLRHWFRDFEITSVSVSPNFNPAYVFAWLAFEAIQETKKIAGENLARRLAESSLADWAMGWEDSSRRGEMWELLGRLPQEIQARFAAGFHLEAIKPFESRVNLPRGD